MAAQIPGAMPSFSGMIGTSTDPLSAPSHVTLEQKQADEIVALATYAWGLHVKYTSGLWYGPEMRGIGSTAQATGTLTLSRYDFPPGTTIVGLGLWVTTAGGAGALQRCCIYDDDGTGYPGVLLKDGGTIDGTVTNFSQSGGADFAAVNVSGTKWLGAVPTVATSTILSNPTQGRSMGLATVANGTQAWAGFTQTGVTGALPGTFTSTRATNTQAPAVFFKVG